jgi:hypothetical protein
VLRRVRVPLLGVQEHDGRGGIPLSMRRLLGVLRKHGIAPLSVDRDQRKKGDMFWVTGQKGR